RRRDTWRAARAPRDRRVRASPTPRPAPPPPPTDRRHRARWPPTPAPPPAVAPGARRPPPRPPPPRLPPPPPPPPAPPPPAPRLHARGRRRQRIAHRLRIGRRQRRVVGDAAHVLRIATHERPPFAVDRLRPHQVRAVVEAAVGGERARARDHASRRVARFDLEP